MTENIAKINDAIEGLFYLISDDCTDHALDYYDEIELAIKALGKRAKMAPLPTNETHSQHGCPCCKHICSSVQKFCENCGQALDWGN